MSLRVLVACLVAAGVGALYACGPSSSAREVCDNGVDDDGNGLADCADPDCAGQPACVGNTGGDAGWYGSCPKCGTACTTQEECQSGRYLDDRPIPYCQASKCVAYESFIQVRMQMDTKSTWSGVTVSPGSGSTRFIKKTARDGSTVDCARVAATASDNEKPRAIEDSLEYTVQGLDVTRITNPQLGQGITYAYVNTQTGGDFLIWSELWGGAPDSDTKLPKGRRLGWGCYEKAADVGGPLVPDDNCPSGTNSSGNCRVFNLVLPGPR